MSRTGFVEPNARVIIPFGEEVREEIMTIAVLGWGSLVWDPRQLPIRRHWFDDGPLCPIEFVRQSSDGRITLVIDSDSAPVRTLWASMTTSDLQAAKEQLRDREGLTGENWMSNVGCWQRGGDSPQEIPELEHWASCRGIHAIIWTALGPRFNGENARPEVHEVLQYLRRLTGPARDYAEQYVRCAPRQIDTEYRRSVEAALGWTPQVCWPPAV